MSTLAIAGFIMVIVFMYLLMTKRITAMNALIVIGIKKVAPTAVMIAFAMMYFSVMIDTGLFDPLINRILKASKGDPMRVVVGTALLAGIVSLDGDGATTYIITTSAMLAVHKKLGINPIILPTMAIMQNGVMNIIPWGGPTGRVMSALGLEASQVFVPLIPAMVAGTIWVVFWAYRLGLQERTRLGTLQIGAAEHAAADFSTCNIEGSDPDCAALKRPNLFWTNLLMTVVLMAALVTEFLPLNVLFMIGTALALMINYPSLKLQQARVATWL
ncbi:MAG: citN [Anaerospora sp.]|nr:citN [Anaerospora sp.]